jgi:hypothetical protein
MQQSQAICSGISAMKFGLEEQLALWSICHGLNCALSNECVVFSPRPIPCEWVPLMGETILANWVNTRRGRVILANCFELSTLGQNSAGRVCSPNVVMVQVQSPAGTVGSKQYAKST